MKYFLLFFFTTTLLLSSCFQNNKEPELLLAELSGYDKKLDNIWTLTEGLALNPEEYSSPETFELMIARLTDTMLKVNKRLGRIWQQEKLETGKEAHEKWAKEWCKVESKALDIHISLMSFWLNASYMFYDETQKDWERLDSTFKADYKGRSGSKLHRKLIPEDEEYMIYQQDELENAKNRIQNDRLEALKHYENLVALFNERKDELQENPFAVIYSP